MKSWLVHFYTGHYNFLLMFLFLLFLCRPYDYGELYAGIWKMSLTLTLIVAIFNCNHSFSTKVVTSILAVPVLILTWINLAYQTLGTYILTSIFISIFMLVCAISIIRDVLMRPKVTLETLRGLICAYFLMAFLFAYIYFFLEYLSPGTMKVEPAMHLQDRPHFFSDMLYFSFVTLLTIGYGDIVPLKEWGETTAVVEGIIGQFYIAILVARIVSVYAHMTGKQLMKTITKEHKR